MNTRLSSLMIVTLFLFIITATMAVSAQVGVQVTVISGVEPKIKTVFNESVILKNATIFKLAEGRVPIITSTTQTTRNPPAGTAATYILTPTRALNNGNYLVQLIASDRVGNELVFTEQFAVVFPETEIRVVNPPLGVTNVTSFDVTIQTSREGILRVSTCKFSSFDPRENFQALGLQPFNIPALGTVSAVHTLLDFPKKFNLLPNVPVPNFFVICIDDLKRVVQQRVFVMIDTISPTIQSVILDPYRIIELPEGGGPFITTASVQASEPVICKFSLDQSKPYSQMDELGAFDPEDISAFTPAIEGDIQLSEEDKRTHTTYFRCQDRAGQLSPEVSRQVQVDLSAAIGITVLSPPLLSLGEALNLTITTDKRAACSFTRADGVAEEITSTDNPTKFHATELGDIAEGKYTLTISCQSGQAGMFQEQKVDYAFTVDKTPPTVPTINGSTVSCAANPLTFSPPITFSAADQQSGIREYRYAVAPLGINTTGNSITKLARSSSGNASGANASLTLTVVAVNQVGLVSAPTTAMLSVNPLHILCLEKNPPVVTITEEKMVGEVKVTLTCTDDTGCDAASFLYGTSDNQSTCMPSINYAGPFSIFRTQTVCYRVKDTAGNNASGSKRIMMNVSNTCTNGVKDNDETDVDCGGSCGSTCSDDKACNVDKDCFNFFCSNGKCRAPSCTDGFLNNRETDVDCGGPICNEKCDVEKKCAQNTDCVSNFCNPETKLCAISTCTDGVKGGNESDVDCGANCPKCEENKQCFLSTDCITDYCNLGFCEMPPSQQQITPLIEEKTFIQKAGSFFLSWGLIILGMLCIAGGSGYLYYKKYLPKPAMPTSSLLGRITRPLTKEELEQRKMEEERKKKITEILRQRLQREEESKKEKRTKLFGAFGEGKKPSVKGEAPTPTTEKAEEEGEWISVEDIGGKAKPAAAKEKAAPSEEEFEKLGKIIKERKPEEDVFAKLPTEDLDVKQPEEDVFAQLPTKEGEVDKDLLNRIKAREEEKLEKPGKGRMPPKRAAAKPVKRK